MEVENLLWDLEERRERLIGGGLSAVISMLIGICTIAFSDKPSDSRFATKYHPRSLLSPAARLTEFSRVPIQTKNSNHSKQLHHPNQTLHPSPSPIQNPVLQCSLTPGLPKSLIKPFSFLFRDLGLRRRVFDGRGYATLTG